MKRVAVQDANILIDCVQLDLLDLVMELPYQFQTTDFILAEMTDPVSKETVQHLVDRDDIHVKEFTVEEVEILGTRSNQYPGLSLEDCSAWYLAEKENGILLTGDGALRKKASQAGIEVRGSLWILSELLAEELITNETACLKITELNRLNSRLPQKSVKELKSMWCGPDSKAAEG